MILSGKKTILYVALLIFITLFPGVSAFCEETVSSMDLIENAKALDGKTVVYKGEAVTAILARGENSWVNTSDGSNAIGVWCASGLLGSIKHLGGYKVRGDILEVRGTFHRACPVHGGELDIHADSVNIIEEGYVMKEKLDKDKLKFSAIILLLTFVMLVVLRNRI
jgi:hypothetical protein